MFFYLYYHNKIRKGHPDLMKLREEVRPHYEIAEKARIDGLPPAEAAKEV